MAPLHLEKGGLVRAGSGDKNNIKTTLRQAKHDEVKVTDRIGLGSVWGWAEKKAHTHTRMPQAAFYRQGREKSKQQGYVGAPGLASIRQPFCFIFVVVCSLLPFFLFRFRARSGRTNRFCWVCPCVCMYGVFGKGNGIGCKGLFLPFWRCSAMTLKINHHSIRCARFSPRFPLFQRDASDRQRGWPVPSRVVVVNLLPIPRSMAITTPGNV